MAAQRESITPLWLQQLIMMEIKQFADYQRESRKIWGIKDKLCRK